MLENRSHQRGLCPLPLERPWWANLKITAVISGTRFCSCQVSDTLGTRDFFLACDEELRRPQADTSSAEGQVSDAVNVITIYDVF